MANSTDMAYARDKFLLKFIDSDCSQPLSEDISEYDKAISEYQMLLEDAIVRNDVNEIKQLRAEIQHTKAEKRIVKKTIARRLALT